MYGKQGTPQGNAPEPASASQFDRQVFQLRLAYWGRRIDHQVFGGGGLGERNHVAQRFATGKNHDDAIQSQSNAAVRRRTVLQGFKEESEALLRFFRRHAQGLE